MFGYASPQELIATVNDLELEIYVHPSRRAEFRRGLEEAGKITGFESEVYCAALYRAKQAGRDRATIAEGQTSR